MLGRTNRRAFFADIPFPALPAPARAPGFVALARAAYHLHDFAANPAEVLRERLGKPASIATPPRKEETYP
jgi:hypothetical protein